MDDSEITTSQSSTNNNTLTEQFDSIINTISKFKVQMTALQNEIRCLERHVKKECKHIKKCALTDKSKSKKAPSGFAKPSVVTKELCAFMNKKEGTEIARTDVTKSLISYIKENNLNFSENKQIIIPDDKLKDLLGLEDENTQLTYFNLQHYMNKHFCKIVKPIDEIDDTTNV